MTTLPPPGTDFFSDDTLEKKIYNLVDKFKEEIPILNDRYRLAFGLYKYMKGEGDKPEILVKTSKLKIAGIDRDELIKKISTELEKVKSESD